MLQSQPIPSFSTACQPLNATFMVRAALHIRVESECGLSELNTIDINVPVHPMRGVALKACIIIALVVTSNTTIRGRSRFFHPNYHRIQYCESYSCSTTPPLAADNSYDRQISNLHLDQISRSSPLLPSLPMTSADLYDINHHSIAYIPPADQPPSKAQPPTSGLGSWSFPGAGLLPTTLLFSSPAPLSWCFCTASLVTSTLVLST
jgi:hypothetical protein